MEPYLIWIIIAIVCFIIEIMTLGLTTIWCVLGAIVAFILALLGQSVTVQILAFVIVSVITFIICLIWIRPIFDKRIAQKHIPTNADKLIGKKGTIVKVFTDDTTGIVKVGGMEWTFISNKPLLIDDKVTVVGMEGIKLIVEEKRG